MAVAFGSAGTYLTYGSRTNSTLVAPVSIADGDLLLAFLFTGAGGSAPTTTPPAGWTALTGSPTSVGDGGFFGKYNIFYRIAASEAGNYTFTHTAASSCGIVARYTGVDTATPFSPTPTVNTGIGLLATATGFTTTVANTFIIFTEHDWGANTTDCTPPAGSTPTFTERLDTVLIYIADGTLPSAGATGNKSHAPNNAGGLDPWGAYLIGLNPSGGGGVAPITFNANPGSYTLTGTSAALGRQIINVGSAIDDGTGDPARVAFTKCNSNFADLYIADTTFLTTTVAAATYQPLDADLTAIAALTGTNTIYYRSGSSTWSAVTIGTNLTFTGGTLSASGGGGDVFLAASNAFTGALNTFTGADTVFGHTAAVDASNKFEVHGTDAFVGIAIDQWSNDGNLPHLHFRKSRGATPGTHGLVSAGDTLAQINFAGSDGSAFPGGAYIQGVVDGTPSAGVMPGMLQFATRGTSGGVTERMRIDSAGLVTIAGNSTSANYPSGAWTAWTPTITASAGTITSTTINTARYTRAGKTITAFLDVTITNAGSGGGQLVFTLPVTVSASGGGNIFGQETVSGIMVGGSLTPSATTGSVMSYVATGVVGTSNRFRVTAIYEGV